MGNTISRQVVNPQSPALPFFSIPRYPQTPQEFTGLEGCPAPRLPTGMGEIESENVAPTDHSPPMCFSTPAQDTPSDRLFSQDLKRKRDGEDCTDLPLAKRHLILKENVTPTDHSPPTHFSTPVQDTLSNRLFRQDLKRKRGSEDSTDLPPLAKRLSTPQDQCQHSPPHSAALVQDTPLFRLFSQDLLKGDEGGSLPIFTADNGAQASTVSLLILPNELLHKIIDLLGIDDLRTCTCISTIFKEIAAPRYLSALNLTPLGRFWTSVDEKNCEALMVWCRMANFTRPDNLYFALCNVTNSHLQAMQIFFESPQSASIPTVYLSCYGGNASLTSIASLLGTIRDSGCKTLSYSARSDPSASLVTSFARTRCHAPSSRFESFSSTCNISFTPPLIPFTLSILHSSLLKELTLNETGLSAVTWGKLLGSLDLPHLLQIGVDCSCPLNTLLGFLQRHPHVRSLQISAYGELKNSRRRTPISVHLPSLKEIGGPSEYLVSFLQRLIHPDSVTKLLVILSNSEPGVRQISRVLDCTQYLPNLDELHIAFYRDPNRGMYPVSGFLIPKHELRTCGANWLKISASFDTVAEGDVEIVNLCASWMKLFPDISSVKLVLGRVAPSEDDVDDVRSAFLEGTHNIADVHVEKY